MLLCRMLSVLDFAEWASVSNAVVFLSVAGSIVRSGQLQSLLGALNVPFTGSQTVEVQICADKVRWAASGFSAHCSLPCSACIRISAET